MKQSLVALYEKIYASNFVMSAIYRQWNKQYRLSILPPEQTIEYILDNACSVTRYGDGEFELMLQPDLDLGFQKRNSELTKRLKKVLSNNNEKLLICIPYTLNSIRGRTEHSRRFWFHWGKKEDQHHRIVSLIKQCTTRFFGDSQITRPYIAYDTPKHSARMFPKLRMLWDGKDVLFVEGEKTRLGVGNDLFANAKSIKRVLCPATNAFDYYDEIAETVKQVWKGELILLALGPTATVMAADFADMGMRTIDIGHLDIEYEWFKRGAKGHDQITGKFTNEAEQGHIVTDCVDENYQKQIVGRIIQRSE